MTIKRQDMVDKDVELTGAAKRANSTKIKELDVQCATLKNDIKSGVDALPLLSLDVYERRKALNVLRQEKLQMQEVLKQAKDEQTTCDVAHAKATASASR